MRLNVPQRDGALAMDDYDDGPSVKVHVMRGPGAPPELPETMEFEHSTSGPIPQVNDELRFRMPRRGRQRGRAVDVSCVVRRVERRYTVTCDDGDRSYTMGGGAVKITVSGFQRSSGQLVGYCDEIVVICETIHRAEAGTRLLDLGA